MPALFISDFSDKYSLFLWLLLWIIIFRLAYGVTTPYQSWTAEQFKVNERPKVSQFQNTFNFIGNGIMALFTLLILTNVFDKLKKSPNIIPSELLIPVLIFAILALALFYFVVIFMPTEPKFEIKSNLANNLKTILKNRNFLKVTLMQGITGIALSMLTAIMLTYAEVVLNLGGFDYIIIAVFLLLGVFISLYIWRKLIGKKGKKQTLLYIFLFGIICLPITLLVLVIPMNLYLLFGIVFIIIIAAILGGWYLFPYVMYADLAEDDEKSTGELKAGIFTGFPSIILNLFQALGIFILGIVVSLPIITIGKLSYSVGLIIWGPICSLVLIISYLYTRKFIVLDFEWEKKLK
jgi:Na+/melibiose symporter-like transporter